MGGASLMVGIKLFMERHPEWVAECAATMVQEETLRKLGAKVETEADDGYIAVSMVWTEGKGKRAKSFREKLHGIPMVVVASVDKDEFGGDCGIDY